MFHGNRSDNVHLAGRAALCALVALIVWVPAQARAQDHMITGAARVIDADTLVVAGERVELVAVLAPQLGQRCAGVDASYDCGLIAAGRLAALVAGKSLACKPFQRPGHSHDPAIAICRVDGEDIGRLLVREGWALAYKGLKVNYLPVEEEARGAGRGMWAMGVAPSWAWPES